jgi:hypothetical protein
MRAVVSFDRRPTVGPDRADTEVSIPRALGRPDPKMDRKSPVSVPVFLLNTDPEATLLLQNKGIGHGCFLAAVTFFARLSRRTKCGCRDHGARRPKSRQTKRNRFDQYALGEANA